MKDFNELAEKLEYMYGTPQDLKDLLVPLLCDIVDLTTIDPNRYAPKNLSALTYLISIL